MQNMFNTTDERGENLTEGQIYKLTVKKEIGKEIKRMRLLEEYRHFALFVDRYGIRECFSYFELAEMAGVLERRDIDELY